MSPVILNKGQRGSPWAATRQIHSTIYLQNLPVSHIKPVRWSERCSIDLTAPSHKNPGVTRSCLSMGNKIIQQKPTAFETITDIQPKLECSIVFHPCKQSKASYMIEHELFTIFHTFISMICTSPDAIIDALSANKEMLALSNTA